MNTSKIRNIIFDLGDVLLPLDIPATQNEWYRLGLKDMQKMTDESARKVIGDFERGKMTVEEFRNAVKPLLCEGVTGSEIDGALSKMLGDVPASTVSLLRELKGGYRLGLLSNTNAIHFPHFEKSFAGQHGVPFRTLVDYLWLSYEIGRAKPEQEIFAYVLENSGFVAEETLFIDDMPENVEAAKGMGILAFRLEDQRKLEELIREIL